MSGYVGCDLCEIVYARALVMFGGGCEVCPLLTREVESGGACVARSQWEERHETTYSYSPC